MDSFSRHSRLLVAIALLFLLSACRWSVQIDDVYISYSYADQWVHEGLLQWQSGERVEGYSNFLWVVVQAVGILLHFPPGFWVKIVSLCSAVAVLGLLHRWLPRTVQGTLLLLGISAWEPFNWWAVIGMETMTAGLLLMLGWRALVQEKWSVAMVFLFGFSLLRPEGLLLLGLGAFRRFTRFQPVEDRREVHLGSSDIGGILVIALTMLYHLLRTDWFGHFWPTPYLVKLAAHHDVWAGVTETTGELLSASLIFFAMIASFQERNPRRIAWALVPLLLPILLLLKAGGDWMGHARWLLPGVLATLGAWSTSESRRTGRWWPLLGLPGLLLGVRTVDGAWELRAPPSGPEALETPQRDDLKWLVEHAPPNAVVQLGDVGMASLIDDIAVLDNNGLVDRAMALFLAGQDPRAMWNRLDGEHPLDCLRQVSVGDEPPPPLSSELQHYFPVTESLRNGPGWSVWSCRAPLCPDPRACAENAGRRWGVLVEKAPDQPWIRLEYARALATLKQDPETRPPAVVADDSPLIVDPAVTWVENRGFFLPTGGCFSGLPVKKRMRIQLDADNPGTEGARVTMNWRCDETWTSALAERAVFGKEIVEISPTACLHPPSLQVCFLNDSVAEGDRNLYVMPLR